MSLHARAEYAKANTGAIGLGSPEIFAFTGTLQYDLWQNVISRLEVRWDHADTEIFGGKTPGFGPGGAHEKNAVMVAANLIYKF